ncbi:MAG: ATP phosphoribosyltransferase regulatory subunit [Pseudomonadota bacterium]
MTALDARSKATQLRAVFEAAGATPVETPVLQPAAALLDLYGEDIRARAYITSDALRGEQMLRPDFTVPVVQMHMAEGAEPACYTYSGKVFRRQEDDLTRASEYLQVGFELFDATAPEQADARVFSTIYRSLGGVNLRAAIGDIGILRAAVTGLNTTDARKSALLRHLWRPHRFRALLDRFSGRTPVPASRRALLQREAHERDAPLIGLRSAEEISTRIEALRNDAAAPPLDAGEVDLLDAVLSIRAKADDALMQLQSLLPAMPSVEGAVTGLMARLEALADTGVDVGALDFEASYGRTQMEYYDGFVFGFYAETRPDLPPVASGGRYDALTRQLGQGREIPAVGGVIRPDLLITLESGS